MTDEPQRARARLGVFGGTFDPVHVGHIAVGSWVRALLELDSVLFVVANEPWQKTGATRISPAQDRLAVVQAAVADVDGLEASDCEIRRGGPTYTVDTLEALRSADPGCLLHLVVGSDAAAGMATWRRFRELPELAEVVVVDRPGALGGRPPVPHRVVECPLVELSSRQIRAWAEQGRPLDGLIPPAALTECRRRGLYG